MPKSNCQLPLQSTGLENLQTLLKIWSPQSGKWSQSTLEACDLYRKIKNIYSILHFISFIKTKKKLCWHVVIFPQVAAIDYNLGRFSRFGAHQEGKVLPHADCKVPQSCKQWELQKCSGHLALLALQNKWVFKMELS